MPDLVAPTVAVHRSFLAAVAEERREGSGNDSTLSLPQFARFEDEWGDTSVFADYVAALCADARPDAPRPDGFVPATLLWWIHGREFLGRLSIRHRLVASLREVGGHIGYVVRPSARRRGHATAMLAAALPVAAGLGIDDALVTADPDNVASRRVIERNGGRFVEFRGGKAHYRIDTAPPPGDAG